MVAKQNDIFKLVDKMPAFPHAVTKVLDLTSRANCSPKDLVEVIEHDPIITVKILKLVNSAFYGLSQPINSISHGVVYVGINTVKNLALTIAAIGMLPRNNTTFDMNAFLLHSLGVAVVSKRLAQEPGVCNKDTSDYFVAGLLHDFGKVVLAQFRPEQFRKALDITVDESIPLFQAEQEIFGLDHAELGGLLAESWKLPVSLTNCIRNHHQPEVELEDECMRDTIYTANQIVNSISFGDSGNRFFPPFPGNITSRCGWKFPELMENLGDLTEEMDKVRAFIRG